MLMEYTFPCIFLYFVGIKYQVSLIQWFALVVVHVCCWNGFPRNSQGHGLLPSGILCQSWDFSDEKMITTLLLLLSSWHFTIIIIIIIFFCHFLSILYTVLLKIRPGRIGCPGLLVMLLWVFAACDSADTLAHGHESMLPRQSRFLTYAFLEVNAYCGVRFV